jgi:uncharacterized protein YegP (UPF0339 family)
VYFYMYQHERRKWRWILFATNGKGIAESGGTFEEECDCLSEIERVMPTDPEIHVFRVATDGGAPNVSSVFFSTVGAEPSSAQQVGA